MRDKREADKESDTAERPYASDDDSSHATGYDASHDAGDGTSKRAENVREEIKEFAIEL